MADHAERNALVRENLAIVGYLVNEVCRKATHVSRDDLASAGALGLVLAAQSFDPALGVPFGAFARRRVLGAIADEMRAADWASRGTRKRIRDSLAVQESLTGALGRVPSLDELAEALGVDRGTAAEALADASRSVGALDEIAADGIAAEIATPEEVAMESERTRHVRDAVRSLPERARYVIEQIYYHDRTVGELAEELGLTHSAVSQQRAAAVRLMREGLEQHYAPPVALPAAAGVAPARRAAYLARLAEQSAARPVFPRVAERSAS